MKAHGSGHGDVAIDVLSCSLCGSLLGDGDGDRHSEWHRLELELEAMVASLAVTVATMLGTGNAALLEAVAKRPDGDLAKIPTEIELFASAVQIVERIGNRQDERADRLTEG